MDSILGVANYTKHPCARMVGTVGIVQSPSNRRIWNPSVQGEIKVASVSACILESRQFQYAAAAPVTDRAEHTHAIKFNKGRV